MALIVLAGPKFSAEQQVGGPASRKKNQNPLRFTLRKPGFLKGFLKETMIS